MYDDDDLYSSFLNGFGTTTDVDDETESTSTYSPSSYNSTTYNPYSTDTGYQTGYRDDYSVTPNYEEQSSYESVSRNENVQQTNQKFVSQMHTPLVQKEAPAVVLTKTKQKIYLHARMKIMIAMFVTIVASLLFVSIFNFVNAGRINASIADKQTQIAELESSIMSLKNEYDLLSDDGTVKDLASSAGYVESSDTNTTVLEVGEVYTKPVVEDLPSNWFNDVCDFLSNLFAA